jgi:hypothetical protein
VTKAAGWFCRLIVSPPPHVYCLVDFLLREIGTLGRTGEGYASVPVGQNRLGLGALLEGIWKGLDGGAFCPLLLP